MKIVVCAKQVPAADNLLKISESGDKLSDRGQTLPINDCDEYAIEEAILLKQKIGGEVSVITVGGLRSQEVLYTALAKGADRGIRIDADTDDSETASKLLTNFLKGYEYDLILTGVESADSMSASAGIGIAEQLNLPHAMIVTKIDVDEDRKGLGIEREFRGGSREVISISLPALLCVQSGIAPMRYAPHLKILQARQKPIRSVTISDLGLSPDQLKKKARIIEMFFPESKKQVEIIKGEPKQAAHELLDKVKAVMM